MNDLQLNGTDLRNIGFPQGKVIGIAIGLMQKKYSYKTKEEVLDILGKVLASPADYLEDTWLSKIADELIEKPEDTGYDIPLNDKKIEYAVFGKENIEEGAITQMDIASHLPVAIAGALMPDAHQGYGLPIGGVLATENSVIPYGVGVDIGCRMCLSIFDIPTSVLKDDLRNMKGVIGRNTLFGSGKEFKADECEENEVLDRKEFSEITLLKTLHKKAARQLGSSGSGNHFVEFGTVEITSSENEFNLPAGIYLALLSHSGSRGLGATIANHYTRLARELCKLPPEAKHLAWLDLNTNEGMEYWLAMNLAGDYASACHHTIHKKIAKMLNTQPVGMIENHHNFAWKEMLNGKEVIVHRKGATPAANGVLGIIPGSMSAPGFIVRGKGDAASLNSASHGAGRLMSRTQAEKNITKTMMQQVLEDNGITLMGAGLDEAPQAYKDIHQVMKSQEHLVDVVGIFQPKIVKMAE